MKKMFRAFLAMTFLVSATAQADVIFTQLAIGPAPAINVAIEIGNTGDQAVSLTGWRIQIYDNGALAPTRTILLSALQSLPAKEVRVVGNTQSNDPTIQSVSAILNGLLAAVDARDLITLVNAQGQIVDSIGQRLQGDGLPTVDRPADICRKSGTLTGNTNVNDAFNSSTEWENCPAPIFSDLGTYQFNTAPVASDVAVNAGLNPLMIALAAVDAENDPLTYSIVTQPTQGMVVPGNPVLYTPNANASGTDTFTYQANDGLLDSNVATVTITFVPLTDRGDGLVICAIGEGSGTANTLGDRNDFITLVNLDESPINLNNHAVQANGFFGGALIGVAGYSLVFTKDLFIQPGQTFTLVNGDGATAPELLAALNPSVKLRKPGRPDGNDVGTFTLNEPQVIVLFEDNGSIPGVADDADSRLDVVGSTNDLFDTLNNPLSTVDNTVFRRKITFSPADTADTNPNDAYDFAALWEDVGADNFSDLTTCFGYTDGYEPLNFKEIAEIQGATPAGDLASPLANQRVVTRGVVTSVGPTNGSNVIQGFYMTSQNRDGNTQTSDGIFVFQPATDTAYTTVVKVGDLVEVGGEVQESFNQTQINATAAEEGSVIKIGTGTVTPLTVTLDATANNQAMFERYEGELVTVVVDSDTTVGNASDLCVNDIFDLGRFGEMRLVVPTPSDTIMPEPFNAEASNCYVWNPTQVFDPGTVGSAREMLQTENNDRNIMILDDNSTKQNVNPVPYLNDYGKGKTLRIGDRVSDLTGVLAYGFSNYRLYPTTLPTFSEGNPRPEATELSTAPNATEDGFQQDLARIRVASFNVLNYFVSDFADPDNRGAENTEELDRQQEKLVNALLDLNADVIGLIEMENLDEPTGYTLAVATLAAALNAAPGSPGTYASVDDLSVANCELANDDAIKNGLLYRTDRVSLASVDCVVNSAFDNARPPLIGIFAINSTPQQFVVVVNHFKSKGCGGALGADTDQDDGQGCFNASRTQQAVVHKAVTDPLTLPAYIIGDLNAYANEAPITTFTLDPDYTDLTQASNAANEVYSYTFPSNTANVPNRATQFGTLDYAIGNVLATDRTVFAAEYHINSPESRIFNYNLNFKDAVGCTNGGNCIGEDVTVTTDPYASSDHDPLLVALNFWNILNNSPDYNANFTRPAMIYDDANGQGLVFYVQGNGPSAAVRVIELSATDGFAGDTTNAAGVGTPYAPTAVRIAGQNLVYAVRNGNQRLIAVNSYNPATNTFSGWVNIQTTTLVNALVPVNVKAIAAAPLKNGKVLMVAVTTADEAYYAVLEGSNFNQVAGDVWQELPTLNNYDLPFMAYDASTEFTILSLRNTADNDIEIFQHNGTTWVYTEQQVASNDTFNAYGMPMAYNAKKMRVDVLRGNTSDNQVYYDHLLGLGTPSVALTAGQGAPLVTLLDSNLDYLFDLDKVPAIGSRPEGVTALFTSEGPGTGRIFFKNSVDGELK